MANVVDISGKPHEARNIPIEEVIADLPPAEALDTLVCLGWRQDGSFFFTSSAGDGGTVLWLLESAKTALLTDDSAYHPMNPRRA